MSQQIKIGFIGFGEAGFNIARGLLDEGLSNISAYDINNNTPVLGEKIQLRARESQVRLCESPAELGGSSDILLSTVTADRAAEAVDQNAPYLTPGHVYADLNSVSPALKRSIGEIVTSRGARFVEGAIMSPVPPHRHRVPIYLGGADAKMLAEVLKPCGMNLEVVSDEIGTASAIKMCRSIVVKGLEALLLECVLAAVPYDADERVFATLDETFPGVGWKRLAGYMVGRVVQHGERRAREMEEVASTLREIGIEPIMAEAASRRQDWCARLNLLPQFGGKVPEDYRTVVRAIDEPFAQTELDC
jgi:3-hydroxyisobutyrate dehydrogenase